MELFVSSVSALRIILMAQPAFAVKFGFSVGYRAGQRREMICCEIICWNGFFGMWCPDGICMSRTSPLRRKSMTGNVNVIHGDLVVYPSPLLHRFSSGWDRKVAATNTNRVRLKKKKKKKTSVTGHSLWKNPRADETTTRYTSWKKKSSFWYIWFFRQAFLCVCVKDFNDGSPWMQTGRTFLRGLLMSHTMSFLYWELEEVI